MFANTVLAVMGLAAVAQASTLAPRAAPTVAAVNFDFPASRGFVYGEGSSGPCGGVSTVSASSYPLSGGDIAFTLVRDMYNLQVLYAPTDLANNIAHFKPLYDNTTFIYPGSQCNRAPNMAELGFAAGDAVTFTVVGETGPKNSTVFNCADVTLVANSDFVAPDYTCLNTVSSRQTRGSSSSSSNPYSVSKVGAGFIGAGVLAAIVLAITGVAFWAGWISLGRKRATQAEKSVESNMAQRPQSHTDASSFDSMAKRG